MASRSRRVITKIVEVMVPLFGPTHDQDEIFISNGNHELVIETNYVPTEVWLTFTEQVGIPVCGGNVDKVGVTLLPKGFILSAQIYSNIRGIRWLAVLDPTLPITGTGPYGDDRFQLNKEAMNFIVDRENLEQLDEDE